MPKFCSANHWKAISGAHNTATEAKTGHCAYAHQIFSFMPFDVLSGASFWWTDGKSVQLRLSHMPPARPSRGNWQKKKNEIYSPRSKATECGWAGAAPRTSANKTVLPLLVACFKWRPNWIFQTESESASTEKIAVERATQPAAPARWQLATCSRAILTPVYDAAPSIYSEHTLCLPSRNNFSHQTHFDSRSFECAPRLGCYFCCSLKAGAEILTSQVGGGLFICNVPANILFPSLRFIWSPLD